MARCKLINSKIIENRVHVSWVAAKVRYTYKKSPYLTIDGNAIKQVKCVKSLGLHIDDNLSWNFHIDKISNTIASGIGALKRCQPFPPQTTLQSINNALIQPDFDYCREVWGIVCFLANKLQILQNRATRILTFSI